MKIVKLSIIGVLILLVLTSPALAGVTKIQVRPFVGLFGGGNALDGVSGYTIHPDDMAIGHDGTGVTWYFMFPQDTGVTTESTSFPYIVCPDDQQAGGGTAGTTIWVQAAISGNTVQGKVFVINTRTVTDMIVDTWNTAYGWGDWHTALALYTSYAQLHTVSGYATDTGVSTYVASQISGVSKDITARTASAAFTGATGFYKAGDSPQFTGVSTFGVTVYTTGGATTFVAGPSGISATNVSSNSISSSVYNGPATIYFQNDGTNYLIIEPAGIRSATNGFQIVHETPTGSNPLYTSQGDPDTGLAFQSADHPSIAAGGVEAQRWSISGTSIFGPLDVSGGVSTFGIVSYDSTGTSQFQVDNSGTHVKTPTANKHAADKAYVDGKFGVSGFTGADLSANQNAVAIAVQFSTSGDSTFVVAPWNFVVSGVSLLNASQGIGVAGASIYVYASATSIYQISGSGTTMYNATVAGRITAGTPLLFVVGTIPTGQTLTEQLFGRKE